MNETFWGAYFGVGTDKFGILWTISVEIISTYADTDKIRKKGLGTIEVIDDRHINWKMLDDNGQVVDSARLTRAPNQ